ncbi:hypothetical protein V6N11_055707 [Hibiscus sabdariffa]|uniref:Uncharacterized protein n=1 Tax=Hibiscus sabdariffa TaxID=183260 RepID=A0ABR2NHA0_9ROSI
MRQTRKESSPEKGITKEERKEEEKSDLECSQKSPSKSRIQADRPKPKNLDPPPGKHLAPLILSSAPKTVEPRQRTGRNAPLQRLETTNRARKLQRNSVEGELG